MTTERKAQVKKHLINFGIPSAMVIPLLTWVFNIYQDNNNYKLAKEKEEAVQEFRIKLLEKQDSDKTLKIERLERRLDRYSDDNKKLKINPITIK